MIVFAKADGTVIDVVPTPIYQGSNLSGSIYFVAPFSRLNAVSVAFTLANGLHTEPYRMTGVSELEGITDKLGKEYSVWEWQDDNAEVTQYAGVVVTQFSVYLPNGQLLTTSRTNFTVQEGVPPEMPPAPSPDVYALILRYLAQLDERTKNVPNLVVSIQKVADNAFTYTNNSNVESAPIVIGEGTATPTLQNNAYTGQIPETAWVAQDVGTQISEYTYTLTAVMHGQMRDGAKWTDLWVSFDETENSQFLGAFKRYTKDVAGNITIYVNQPVNLAVRVWNGKGGYDAGAREEIAAETARAEAAEQNLQTQITELQNTGVDEVARADIAAETARAEAAEAALHDEIVAETTRAKTAESNLQSKLTKMTTFSETGWNASPAGAMYLGAVRIALPLLGGSPYILQVVDVNNHPRGTWHRNFVYANEPFAGIAIYV